MRALRLVVAVLVAAVVVGCAPDPGVADPSAAQHTTTPSQTRTATPRPTVDPLARLSLPQRVGQLFMVGTPVEGPDPVALSAVTEGRAGGLFLHGRSSEGAGGIAALVAGFGAPAGPPLWVATDQEGGDVQVLSGDGFADLPSALRQGEWDAATLTAEAAGWGRQLVGAGVNMNLAPVADIVTSPDTAPGNPPIGAIDRQYGFDRPSVEAKAGAFAAGMREAGVMPTFKHFPGLGRVTANTDYSTDVRDAEVGADSDDVKAYRALLAGGPSVVMMSNAVYERMDPGAPAVFSPAVVGGVLRDRLGFEGVVMTDDLSASDQVEQWAPADRALLALDAGVDLVLVSADASVFPEMYDAVLARAAADPAFAARVDDSARRVLAAKAMIPGAAR